MARVGDYYQNARGDLCFWVSHDRVVNTVTGEVTDVCGLGAQALNQTPALTAAQMHHQQTMMLQQAQMQLQAAQQQALNSYANGIGGLGGLAGLSGGLGAQNMKGMAAATSIGAPHVAWSKKAETTQWGEILAWRVWRVSHFSRGRQGQPTLESVVAGYTWEPGKVAEGDVLNGFGIHAYKDAYGPVRDGYATGDYAVGQVLLWGDVIEHEHGYRAQYARIHSLDHFTGVSDKDQKFLRKAYL